MKRLIGSMASMVSLATAGLCHAAPPCGGYEVEILPEIRCPGPLPDFSVEAKAINAAGVVAGHYQNHCAISGPMPFEGFTWTPQTGIVTIPRPPGVISLTPADISDNGFIVGRHTDIDFFDPGEYAFIYDGERLTSLYTLPGGTNSEAYAVNSSGRVVGWWGNILTGIPTGSEAFIWQDDVMYGLGPDIGFTGSSALDVNEIDAVTGWVFNESGTDTYGFIWQDGKTLMLPPIPGGISSAGYAINDSNDVVGIGTVVLQNGDEVIRPYAYLNGAAVALPICDARSECFAQDINNDQVIVGDCDKGDSCAFAALWIDGVLYDLNSLIDPIPDLTLYHARQVSENGMIVAAGNYDSRGVSVRLTPRASAGPDLSGNGIVDGADIMLLIESWGRCVGCCAADFDRNRIVNGFDLAMLLGAWGGVNK